MNIEEERKAFVESMKAKLIDCFGCGCLAEGYDKDSFDSLSVQIIFEGWLAAKKHSEEMAKPQCNVVCDYDGEIWLVGLAGRVGPGFATAEEARVWALNNGYRVIEE